MKLLSKYRLTNKVRFLLTFIFLAGLFVTWFFTSGNYSLLINYFKGASTEYIQSLSSQINNISNYTDLLIYASCVFPVLACSMGIFFFKEKLGYFPYEYTRGQSQKKAVFKSMFVHCIYSAALV